MRIQRSLLPDKNAIFRTGDNLITSRCMDELVFKLNYITQTSIAPYGRNFRGAGRACERLGQGRYSAMRRSGLEPATWRLPVQHRNRYTAEPQGHVTRLNQFGFGWWNKETRLPHVRLYDNIKVLCVTSLTSRGWLYLVEFSRLILTRIEFFWCHVSKLPHTKTM